jgi:hypothetical protein
MTIENACDIVSLIFCCNVARSSTLFRAAFALTVGHVLKNERLIALVRANLDKCTVDELSKIPIATLQAIIQFSELGRGKLFDLKFELAIGIYGRVGRPASVLFKGVKCQRLSVSQFGALRACQDFDESNLDHSLAELAAYELCRSAENKKPMVVVASFIFLAILLAIGLAWGFKRVFTLIVRMLDRRTGVVTLPGQNTENVQNATVSKSGSETGTNFSEVMDTKISANGNPISVVEWTFIMTVAYVDNRMVSKK